MPLNLRLALLSLFAILMMALPSEQFHHRASSKREACQVLCRGGRGGGPMSSLMSMMQGKARSRSSKHGRSRSKSMRGRSSRPKPWQVPPSYERPGIVSQEDHSVHPILTEKGWAWPMKPKNAVKKVGNGKNGTAPGSPPASDAPSPSAALPEEEITTATSTEEPAPTPV